MKKIISAVLLAAMIISLFALNVSAAGQKWISVDFEADTVGQESTSMPDGEANPSGAARFIEEENGNKIFRFNNLSSTNIVNTVKGGSVSASEVLVKFDFKMNSSAGEKKYLCIDLHAGNTVGTRYSVLLRESEVESGGAFSDGKWGKPFPNTTGKWFTYFIHWRNVGKNTSAADIYRKERDSSEDYVFIGTSKPATQSGWGSAEFRIYGNGVDCAIDNILMWNGTVFDGGSFAMDDEAITALSQVTGGELKATASIISGDSDGSAATPVMVVFDSNGRMVDCEFGAETDIAFGANSFSVSADTSDYYDSLDGGAVELYIWEDIELARPMVDAIILD